jgi:predicted RNA-binding Zn-ribbon protein involved in translation (DUF1610 family)
MKRPRAKFYDLSKLVIGAADKPSQTGRQIPQIRIPAKKTKFRGQCPTCGGSKVIHSQIAGETWLCPQCTGYQKCGL